ncbi:MAG: hypothetical protein Ct9H90mP23_2210 [Methanobacteriota archaeon]|nr:MAG: hypothetical protein Ct9H90mP23_2210 [Euryarchaeota archaeon]
MIGLWHLEWIRRSHGMGVNFSPIMMYTFARELEHSALLEIKKFSELGGVSATLGNTRVESLISLVHARGARVIPWTTNRRQAHY